MKLYQFAVLASFMPGKVPVPHKVILRDSLGNEITFGVDKRYGISNQISIVTYKCETFFDGYAKRYLLMYWKEEMEWKLRNDDFFVKKPEYKLPY